MVASGIQGTMNGINIGKKPPQYHNNETSCYIKGIGGHSKPMVLLSYIHDALWG
jgi:hypothetical protein